MLQFVDRDIFAVAHSGKHLLVGDILAVADIGGIFLSIRSVLNIQRIRIFVFYNEALDVGHLAVDLDHFDARHIGLVVFLEDLLYNALSKLLSVVVDQVDFGTVLHRVLDRQEAPVLCQVVTEDGQSRTMVHAGHTADALVVVDRRGRAGGGLADGPLRAGESAGVAGETVEAVELHKRFCGHSLGGGQVGLLQQAHGVLLRIDILARDVEILVVVEPHAYFLRNLVGRLTAAEHGAGSLADTDGVADSVHMVAEQLFTLGKQLAVRHQSSADIDNVYVVDNLFGTGDGLEVLAFCDNGADNARTIAVGNGAYEGVTCHDGDAQTAHSVGLHRETALTRHRLDDGLDCRTGLHSLVGGEVTDITCTHGEHPLPEECMLLVHHLLEHGGGVNAWYIVVFKGRHERNGAGGHHQVLRVDVGHLARHDVFQGQTRTFENIPHRVAEEDTTRIVAGKGLRDVESAHAAVLLLAFEEEELVGLHVELASDALVIVNHEVVDTESLQLLAAGQSRRTGADNGHGGLEYLEVIQGFLIVRSV